MQAGKFDVSVDELILLANELKYGGDYVKDKARVGMTSDLCTARAMKTPHPEDSVDYLNLLQNTGYQLEDVASFNHMVVRAIYSSRGDKSDDRHTSTKKQRKERNGSRPRNPKPTNPAPQSFRPPESKPAKVHKDILQTLIDRRQQLNKSLSGGDPNYFWHKSPAATPVVALAKLNHRQTVTEVGHLDCAPIPKARRIEVAPPAVKQGEAEVGRWAPEILEVDTHASDSVSPCL